MVPAHLGQNLDSIALKWDVWGFQESESIQLMPECPFCDSELRRIGPIEAVYAVCTEDALLDHRFISVIRRPECQIQKPICENHSPDAVSRWSSMEEFGRLEAFLCNVFKNAHDILMATEGQPRLDWRSSNDVPLLRSRHVPSVVLHLFAVGQKLVQVFDTFFVFVQELAFPRSRLSLLYQIQDAYRGAVARQQIVEMFRRWYVERIANGDCS